MLIKFCGQDNTLDSKPFVNDEVQFNLIQLIRESEVPYLFTNKNKSMIIAQSALQFPAWVWTDNQITKYDKEELKNDFAELYKDADRLVFIAKPDIAIELAEHYSRVKNIKYSVVLQMESFQCQKVIEPKPLSGFLRKAALEDVKIISQFLSGFIYDCFGKTTTPDEQIQNAKCYIENGNLYVWCNDDGIISMANIAHRSKRNARINAVYTRPDMRGKGFGAVIVAEICRIILDENRLPVLYTDLANPASNKAYKNVGFVECGRLTQIAFDFNMPNA
ncbi:GNAT family N-acetyltransferase [Clostridium hydrogenum]|uniref:GNAT family N-acetyltransferase n=1 Tax=Clostridium hydrogenum TaxID=2855764 RepID=UPI001F1C6CF8|nr:GNAT family N-acetyltransferase [Clostridium hydrogenum]